MRLFDELNCGIFLYIRTHGYLFCFGYILVALWVFTSNGKRVCSLRVR